MVNDRGGELRDLRIVSAGQVNERARMATLRLLYNAAKRDVCADPVGSLARYQPTWYFPARSGFSVRLLARSAANSDRF